MRNSVPQGAPSHKTASFREFDNFYNDLRDFANIALVEKASAGTSDATATSIWTDTMPEDSAWRLSAWIVARDSAGNAAWYDRTYSLKRSTAAPTVVGTASTDLEDVAAWGGPSITVAASGAVEIQVTGDVATTIRWAAMVTVHELRL